MLTLNIQTDANGARYAIAPITEKRDGADVAAMSSIAWDAFSGTSLTVSGEPVSTTVALQHSTVYACVFAIASAIASMPLLLYRKLPKGRVEAVESPLYRVFTVEPNADMNAKDLWFALIGALALHGNAYGQILRNADGDAVGLYPLDPRYTEPVRLPTKQLAYKSTVGSEAGAFRIVPAADMLHLKFLSWNGLKGLSPIDQARNSVGLAIAAEKYGAKFFGNNTVPPALLSPVGEVSEEEFANMRTFWERANSAVNQGRIGVLPSDWKLTQLAITPEQSQFLATRQYNRTDIASLFNISPSRAGDMQKQSKASAEQENISFVTDTLQPYMTTIECEIQRKLLPRDGSMFVEFDASSRLRGDFATTMQGFAVGKQWGIYSSNDIREKLGENPIGSEGDIYYAPVNMTNLKNLADGKPPLSQQQPTPVEEQK